MFPGFAKVVLFAALIVGCLSGPIGNGATNAPETTRPHDARNCSEQDLDICITKDCTLTAAMLISAMDTSIDPCTNFYTFTCDNYIRTHPVPEDKVSVSTFSSFNRDFDLQLKNLVEGLGSLKGANAIYRAQELYHVCINTTYQKDKEVEAFRNFTRDILDWPMVSGSDWQPQKESLSDHIAVYGALGLEIPWASIMVHPDRTVVIKVEPLSDALEAVLFVEGSPQARLMKELLHMLGVDDDEAIDKDLEDMRKLVQDGMTATVSPDDEASSGDLRQEVFEGASESLRSLLASTEDSVTVTFQQLRELTNNNFDWLNFLNSMIQNVIVFDEHDNVNISNPLQFRKHFAEINKLPQRTVNNVMAWKGLMNLVQQKILQYSSHEFRDLFQNLEKDDSTTSQTQPRWKSCLESLNHVFSLVTTRLFIDKYIDRKGKASATELIQLIQDAYINSLRESDWLDEETKKKAILKAEKIERHVAYPDFIFDDQKLDEYYMNTLPQIRSTLFENGIEYYSHTKLPNIISFYLDIKQHDFEEWNMDLLQINAMYMPTENSMWFPIGILQLPFFHNSRLAALNFGMIGAVIGHEIGHAFDVSGSEYNEKGQPADWWSEATKEEYKKKSQCFVHQYDSFCPEALQGGEEPVCVKGEATLGENQADFTGLNAAYNAYRLWVEKHGAEKLLPGLQEFTPEQLLFIGYAHIWCENIPVDKWVDSYAHDEHSPNAYRVLGALSNSVFFRETFECPTGKMNRGNDSCTMW